MSDNDLTEVSPEPLGDEESAIPETPGTPDQAKREEGTAASPAAAASPSSPRMPSMTDVLNSAPSSPVVTKEQQPASQETTELHLADEIEDENPPPPPPRPLSPFSQAQKTLEEAFPSIEKSVVKAVLIASGGHVDPAFNALLSMSDPGFVPELPPRPAAAAHQTPASPTKTDQVLADEAYARKLAAELNNESGSHSRPPRASSRRNDNSSSSYERRSHRGAEYDGTDDYLGAQKEYSFFDDDLPIIKENLTRGFQETRSKVNEWVANFKKKIDGEDDDSTDYYSGSSSGRVPSKSTDQRRPSQQSGSSSSSRYPRQTKYDYSIGRQHSYDKDPTELDGNFAHLNLVDSSRDPPPPRPPRPTAVATSLNTTSSTERLYSPTRNSPASPQRSSGKWEPLRAVEPTPDRDPFFIGDSDDEGEETGKKQVRFASGDDDLK
ncbi:hypothetical protein BZA70DRAFT_296226 [Myxozyma melibiosi]|uniref:CUE domain-containing protein n=1 Tax=Myxozyma melibiosi TaxID=54550 RepID=A0ABR1F3P1_9ASCO